MLPQVQLSKSSAKQIANKENVTFCHSTARYGELYCSPREQLQVPRYGEWDCSPRERPGSTRCGEWDCSPRERWRFTRRGELRCSPKASDEQQVTGLQIFTPKVPNPIMLNLKTIWNISTMIILGSVFNFYISFTILHHLIINSSLLT